MFNDVDDYYKPILAKQACDGNYQIYTCRGNKDKPMSLYEYILLITPYLLNLIDQKKTYSNKIQLVVTVDFIHVLKTLFHFMLNQKNVICTPVDDSNDILDELVDSLLKYYIDTLLTCRTDSSYVFMMLMSLIYTFTR